MRCVLVYDVESDRVRVRLAKFLLDYGDRVQKSVFEADLSADDVRRITAWSSKRLGDKDSLRIYWLCKACEQKIETVGRWIEPLADGFLIID